MIWMRTDGANFVIAIQSHAFAGHGNQMSDCPEDVHSFDVASGARRAS